MSTIRGRMGVIPGVIPGVGLIAAILVGGCVEGPRINARTGGGPMVGLGDPALPDSADLAARARRDSEWMLERIGRNDAAPPPQPGLVANPLVQIKWNDPSPSHIRLQRRPPGPP
ncbi:MAG: hypothetical protein V3T07_08880, partial [Myxococcota bacterium]